MSNDGPQAQARSFNEASPDTVVAAIEDVIHESS